MISDQLNDLGNNLILIDQVRKDESSKTMGRKDKKQNVFLKYLLVISLTTNPNLYFDFRIRSVVLNLRPIIR